MEKNTINITQYSFLIEGEVVHFSKNIIPATERKKTYRIADEKAPFFGGKKTLERKLLDTVVETENSFVFSSLSANTELAFGELSKAFKKRKGVS